MYGEGLSGFCNCFGGADGARRHLSASLFDLLSTITKQNDSSSCTSKPCIWIQKKRDFASTPAFKLNLGKREDTPLLGQLESHQIDPRSHSVVACCEKRQKLLQCAIHDIFPEAVSQDILPAIAPEANPLREDFPIEHDINVFKEEEAIVTPHTPCMSDIIKELKMNTKEENLTTREHLELGKNYVLNYNVSKDQREQMSLITVGQSSNSNSFKHRIGRTTGSVAHRVLTRRESTDPTSLINPIMGKHSLDDDKLPPQMDEVMKMKQ